jgi:hypothetical protein
VVVIKVGDIVKMSEALKARLISLGCEKHVEEFGNCLGSVEADFLPPDLIVRAVVKRGKDLPEEIERDCIVVRWLPSGAKYPYTRQSLEVLEPGGMHVSRVIIDIEDQCDSCGAKARGRLAAAFGAGRPVICWRCLKAARHVVPENGMG